MEVKLTANSHKGKNRLTEIAQSLPGWDGAWEVRETRDTIQARAGGPWLFLAPCGANAEQDQRFSRWVQKTGDPDFGVQAL